MTARRLWLLRARSPLELPLDDPWTTDQEALYGAVIRARDERQARLIAQAAAGAETHVGGRERRAVWLVDAWTVCVEIPAAGPPALILASRHVGGAGIREVT